LAEPITASALVAGSARSLGIGDRVYLIGYPQADPAAPRATITEGIVAGAEVEWLDGLTYLETDAAIDNGQSGGVIVDDQGRFRGVTGGSRGSLAVALEASDAVRRATRLAAGDDVDGLPAGVLPSAADRAPHDVSATIHNRADEQAWILTGHQGDAAATLKLTADGPVGLFGLAAAGALGHGAGPPSKAQTLTFDFDPPGPYVVKVQSVGHGAVKVKLHSTVGLTLVADAEDGKPLALDAPQSGRADYAGDIDWFSLDLEKGQRVTVRVSGAGFDPALFLDATGATDETLVTGHDAGGPLGMDDELSYTARASATYRVVVADGRFLGSGGYRVFVTRTP
jgi:hypothetical protein